MQLTLGEPEVVSNLLKAFIWLVHRGIVPAAVWHVLVSNNRTDAKCDETSGLSELLEVQSVKEVPCLGFLVIRQLELPAQSVENSEVILPMRYLFVFFPTVLPGAPVIGPESLEAFGLRRFTWVEVGSVTSVWREDFRLLFLGSRFHRRST